MSRLNKFPSFFSLKALDGLLGKKEQAPPGFNQMYRDPYMPMPFTQAASYGRSEATASPTRKPHAGAFVLAVINNKGGVGKTTTAVNLAAALSIKQRVLLIDLDSQGSATLSLGHRPREGKHGTMTDVLCQGVSLQEVIQSSGMAGLDYVPGGLSLVQAANQLITKQGATFLLRDALQPVRNQYDYILLDCTPTFTPLSHNALVASEGCIVPVMPHYLAIQGLENLLQTMKVLDDPKVPLAPLWGIVLTMVDDRDGATPRKVSDIRRRYPGLVFQTTLPLDLRLAEAPESGKSIFDYAFKSKGALSYWELSKEIIERSREFLYDLRTDYADVEASPVTAF